MRFLVDMPISPLTISFLRDQGHDVASLREQNLQRLPDADILAKARDEKRAILTMDLDFGHLMAISGGKIPSILLFRHENKTAEYINDLLKQHLGNLLRLLDQGIIAVFDGNRVRVRELPVK